MRKREGIPENCFGYALKRLGLDEGGYVELDEEDITKLFCVADANTAEVILWRDECLPCHLAVVDKEERGFVWHVPEVGGDEEHIELKQLKGLHKQFFKVKKI